jgi:hypothetical protein
MSDDLREHLKAAYADAEDLERRIEDVRRRILTDPIVHAVGHIMRQAIDHESGREQAILAGTAAILPFLTAAEARGYAKAVAALRNSDRFVQWAFKRRPETGIISDVCADYLEAV